MLITEQAELGLINKMAEVGQMKIKEMITFLNLFDHEAEIEIEIYETETGAYVDSTAVIAISNVQEALGPVLKIDVEADKFRKLLR